MSEKIFCNQIDKIRQSRGFTQKKLAKNLNVDVSIIKKWESNNSQPSNDMLSKIAKVLDVSVNNLVAKEKIKSKKDKLEKLKSKVKGLYNLIEHDDVTRFIKYRYCRLNWLLDKNDGNKKELNVALFKKILSNHACKIFEKCLDVIISNVDIKYNYIFDPIINEYVKMCIDIDYVKGLNYIQLKLYAVENNFNNNKKEKDFNDFVEFKSKKSIIKKETLDYFFINKKKSGKCFNYIININFHKEDDNKIFLITYMEKDILLNCINYNCEGKINRLLEYFFEETKKSLQKCKNLECSFINSYIYFKYSNSENHICGRYIILDKYIIDFAIQKQYNYDQLIDYNRNVYEIINNLNLNFAKEALNIYIPTKDEIYYSKLQLIKNINEEEKIIIFLKNCQIVDIEKIKELISINTSVKNVEFCKKMLEKPISYYELIKYYIFKNDWKSVFIIAVDINCSLLATSVIKKEYKYIKKNLCNILWNYDIMLKCYPLLKINSNEINYNILCDDHNCNGNKDTLFMNEINIVKNKWINILDNKIHGNVLEDKLETKKNTCKIFYENEVQNGDVKTSILMLCKKMKAKLVKILNKDDDISILLNEYINLYLNCTEIDIWGDFSCNSDYRQIQLLNKLVSQNNKISNSIDVSQLLTKEELIECIDYIFKI